MAWLQSHQDIAGHPKTNKFRRKLGVNVHESVGILHYIWYWAMDHAGDGDISHFSAEDIADGCQYQGNADELLEALESSGYIEDNRLWRWDEIGGKLLISREKSKERVYKARGKKKDNSEPTSEPVTEMLRVTNANVTPVLQCIELDLDLELEKEKELKELKESVTPPSPKPKKEPENIPAQEIIDYMNQVSGRKLTLTDESKKLITARWKQHSSLESFKHVIDVRWAEVQRKPDTKKWFNNITPFRPDNFALSLTMEIEDVAAAARHKGTSGKIIIQGITPAAAAAAAAQQGRMSEEELQRARDMARKLDQRLNNKG